MADFITWPLIVAVVVALAYNLLLTSWALRRMWRAGYRLGRRHGEQKQAQERAVEEARKDLALFVQREMQKMQRGHWLN